LCRGSVGEIFLGWKQVGRFAFGQSCVRSDAGSALFFTRQDARLGAEEMVAIEAGVIEEHLERSHRNPGVATGVLQIAQGLGDGDGDASYGTVVDCPA
jgi:hypothetical protein